MTFASTPTTAPSPLFVDPNYHGSCDPEIILNPAEKKWIVFYTARRATRSTATYVGTPIGVIESPDLANWTFQGYCDFEDDQARKVVGGPDLPVTFWAPGIIRNGDQLHMFVTYKPNATPPWGGKGEIRHYVAPLSDPIHGWKQAAAPQFAQPDPIDATIAFDDVANRFIAYYRVGKDGKTPSAIHFAFSADLETWQNQGEARGDVNTVGREKLGYQEAPYLFRFGGYWWLITDPHQGLACYRSDDAVKWTFTGLLLDQAGSRPMDTTIGRHPSVIVDGSRCFLVYHVEPNRQYGADAPGPEQRSIEQKKAVLQMCELEIIDGELKSDRNRPIELPIHQKGR